MNAVWVCVTLIDGDMSVSAHETQAEAEAESLRVVAWAGTACEMSEVHGPVEIRRGGDAR